MKRVLFIPLLLLVSLVAVAQSDTPTVKARIEPDSIFIGDQFDFIIEVEKDLVQTTLFPEFTPQGESLIELVEVMPIDTLERDGRRLKIAQRYRLAAFQEGRFYIQDAGARLAVLAAGPEPGTRVLDACAAPGGKSFAAAIAMEDRGEVLSCDIHPHKKKLIEAGAKRLGLTCVQAGVLDARSRKPGYENAFDLVMADVPCSGLGIIRKKPDIRYKDPAPLEGLPAVQRAILDNVSAYVRPGGVLLYCTCTLLPRENGEVVDAFLDAHPDFQPEAFSLPAPIGPVEGGRLTLWPHIHGTDGFYIAKLRRCL